MDSLSEVMIDLETMSTHDNASIVSIGAVRFMPPSVATLGTIVSTFYVNVDLATCMDAGLHVESRTVKWWEQQSADARKRLEVDPQPLNVALEQFTKWFGANQETPIWANPPAFDLTILGNAYRVMGVPEPWYFYSERCYRTLRGLFPSLPYARPMVPHDALEDATAQALHLLKMLKLTLPFRGATNVDNS
jgi:hypothetical protein